MRKRSAFGTDETGKPERVVGQLDGGGADMPANLPRRRGASGVVASQRRRSQEWALQRGFS